MERMDAGQMMDHAAGKELAELAAARALREEILAYSGGRMSNTADELRELRAERDAQLSGEGVDDSL